MERSQPQPSSPPSSPLSVLSQSPSLPPTPFVLDAAKRYPSPSSTSSSALPSSGSASPMKMPDVSDSAEIQVRTDGPPAKRRRIAAPPRPRTTEYIDLEARTEDDEEHLDRLVHGVRKKKKVLVIAGAGISVAAGIPDFRSSTGLFTTLRGQHKLKASGKHLFDASVYKHDSSTTSFHTMVRGLAQLTAEAQPTNFHHMLASIAEEGRLMRLYTQNIDSIDTQMPPLATNVPLNTKGPWPVTIQLHGGLEKMVCTKCGHLEPFNASLFEGPEAPLCKKCEEQDQVRTAFAGKRSHGIGRLRPRIVLYNEYNPDEEAIGNVSKADLRRVPDVVLVVGTSLKIPGVRRIVKEMCQLTRSKRDGITAWINTDPEPQGAEFKDCWDFVVRGKCDDFAELVNLPRWDQQDIGERDSYMVTGDETKEQRYQASVSRDRIEVPLERKRKSPSEDIIPSSQDRAQASTDLKSKLAGQTQGGIPTPGASPKLRNPLPLTKPAGRGRPPKQSTLIFNGNVKESTPAPVPEVPKAKRKPRQSKKKEPAKPRNTLNNAFKATKAVASDGKKNLQKQASVDIELPDMSSRVDLANGLSSTLPSLRPMNKVKTPTALKSESLAIRRGGQISPFATSSPPTTPVTDTITSPKTISPTSKPRAMGHLID